MDESDEFSDGLDEFEASIDENKQKALNKNRTTYQDKPYDEAYEISQDLSMAESFDGRDKKHFREHKLENDKYDEAVEVSQSIDQGNAMTAAAKAKPKGYGDEKDFKTMKKGAEQTKSQTVLNNKFDEALEFSRSGSEESVDTRASQKNKQQSQQEQRSTVAAQPVQQQPMPRQTPQQQPSSQEQPKKQPAQKQPSPKRESGGDGESSEEDGDHEESFDNIEGAYNPKDYLQLNVIAEVRDLFQYIERYKPQEVELETPLKCFIPEYIPAIGELDAFIKVPRPDNKEDGLGLRYLDEPSTTQSDPTVLELQLRAKSKRLQYGDVVVRSIENADKNPAKIEKWIQDISELHRSKPPPQVNYKKNMPEMDQLMEVWPEEFESFLAHNSNALPSPDLDMSLGEYAKTLCSLLDIPTYDNPIESLHQMFSLFVEFRNNPHFQARMQQDQQQGGGNGGGFGLHSEQGAGRVGGNSRGRDYGAADVLEIEQDYK